MYPPLILHLGLIFPRRRPILERHPIVLRWIYAAAFMAACSRSCSCDLHVARRLERCRRRAKRQIGAFVRPLRACVQRFVVLVGLNILWAARREGVKRAIVIAAVACSLAVVAVLLRARARCGNVHLDVPRRRSRWSPRSSCRCFVLASFPIFALVALYRSYREANAEEKRQVAWPLWGLLVAIGARSSAVVVIMALIGVGGARPSRPDRVARHRSRRCRSLPRSSPSRFRSPSPSRFSSTG